MGNATNGAEAIARWRETEPDVILLDQQMPEMTGLEAAEAILAEQPDQRIILYSAYLDPETHRKASELGIRACVPKGDLTISPMHCGDSARVEVRAVQALVRLLTRLSPRHLEAGHLRHL